MYVKGGKFSKAVENIVGKGEIACNWIVWYKVNNQLLMSYLPCDKLQTTYCFCSK